jgi:translation initiation factor 2B subunit (eIF-2B alpha/beta/delta family)
MDQGRNEGISMSGGRIEAGALAIGRGARATNVVEAAGQTLTGRGQAELADRLADLVRQLEAHASRLDNADELRETTEAVASELAKDKPNRITVTGLLDGLAKGVGSVAGLTTAVHALAQAAMAVL